MGVDYGNAKSMPGGISAQLSKQHVINYYLISYGYLNNEKRIYYGPAYISA
jgi:hypothetical protein